ncbi:MAG: hypothetical protein KC503_40225 [Myxococcales bacterium]|nr:hypothetical protein [Myxococcales bacterium]
MAATPALTLPVLVVSSDPPVGDALLHQIEKVGVVPRLAESAHGALDLLLRSETALLVVDGRSRIEGGVDLVETARQISPSTRILVLEPPETAHTLPRDVLVLSQPAQPAVLRSMVASALGFGSVVAPLPRAEGTPSGLSPLATEVVEPVASSMRRRALLIGGLAIAGAAAGALAFVLMGAKLRRERDAVTVPPAPSTPALKSAASEPLTPVTTPLDDPTPAAKKKSVAASDSTAANKAADKTDDKTADKTSNVQHVRTSRTSLQRPKRSKRAKRHHATRRRARARAVNQHAVAPAPATPAPAAAHAAPAIAAPAPELPPPPAVAAKPAPAKPAAAKPVNAKKRGPRIGTVGSKRKPNIGMID